MQQNKKISGNVTNFRREMKLRDYSPDTIRVYCRKIEEFLIFSFQNSYPPAERIAVFLSRYSQSPVSVTQCYSAIKLFYLLIIGKKCPYLLDKKRVRKRIPTILSNQEIHAILDQIGNEKHYLMISLLYGAGLRVSEVVGLRVQDIFFDRLKIVVKEGKGRKSRITLLPEKLACDLKKFVKYKMGKEILFATNIGKPYSKRTVQMIFTHAKEKAAIINKASCHSLRHSFATHLVESGVNIKIVKELLGHKSVKTTMVYVHVADALDSKIKSPF